MSKTTFGDVNVKSISKNGTDLKAGTVAALQENSGAIGGTNDGNLPNLTAVSSSYVQAEAVAVRDAVRELAAKQNQVIAALKAAGLMA